ELKNTNELNLSPIWTSPNNMKKLELGYEQHNNTKIKNTYNYYYILLLLLLFYKLNMLIYVVENLLHSFTDNVRYH
ncbi:MAG: hypothetical protein N7Q72_02690, partial [Spiroplasma sp. Tabriz.8]|nr:hypothetical protein [Spiroplasma sp. Tabriz.8]